MNSNKTIHWINNQFIENISHNPTAEKNGIYLLPQRKKTTIFSRSTANLF